jgi:hypothetical protein
MNRSAHPRRINMNVSIQFTTKDTASTDNRSRAHVLHGVDLEAALAIGMALRGNDGVEAVIVVAGRGARKPAAGPQWPGAGLLARLRDAWRGRAHGLQPVPL